MDPSDPRLLLAIERSLIAKAAKGNVSAIKELARRADPTASAARARRPPDHVPRRKLTPLPAYLRRAWEELEAMAIAATKAGSWQAAAKAKADAIALRRCLEQERPVERDPTADLTVEQLVADLVALIADLPDHALDAVETAIAVRRAGGGRKAEEDG